MKKIIVLLGASATGKDTVAKHISENIIYQWQYLILQDL